MPYCKVSSPVSSLKRTSNALLKYSGKEAGCEVSWVLSLVLDSCIALLF